MRSLLTLALLLVLLPGCPSTPWGFDFPDVGVTERSDTGYLPCTAASDPPTDASLDLADEALSDFHDGTVEVALSPLGCVRYERRIEGGQLVEAHIRAQIDVTVVGYDLVPVIATLASWERGPDGVLRGGLDADDMEDAADDTYFERREVVDPAARRIERTWWNEATDQVVERLVIEATADGMVHQTFETMVDGVLTTVEDDVSGGDAEADYPPGGTEGAACVPTTCSAQQTARLERLYRQSLHRRMSCFATRDAGRARAAAFENLVIRWHSGHEFRCLPAGCNRNGRMDLGSLAGSGPVIMEMQVDGRSDDAVTDTLMHELTHGVMGRHTVEANRLRNSTGTATVDGVRDEDTQVRLFMMYLYSDPAAACTSFCGTDSTFRNRCTCAACLGVRPCDEPCASLPSCTLDNAAGDHLASEAIGTICRVEGSADTYFSTYATCTSACGGECRSLAPEDPCSAGCR